MQNVLRAGITDKKFYHLKQEYIYWCQGEPAMGWAWVREVWAKMAQRADEKKIHIIRITETRTLNPPIFCNGDS